MQLSAVKSRVTQHQPSPGTKAGNRLQEGGRFKITYDEDTDESVLTIKDVTASDAGKYTCYLKSPQGQETSSISLKVTPKPKEEAAIQMPVEKLEEVEVLPEISKPEEEKPELVPVELPEEVVPQKKPAVIEAPEEVTEAPKKLVALEGVTEEQLETAVIAKYAPHPEEEVEVLAEITKPEEVTPEVVSLEEAPEEIISKKKPAFIMATEEEITQVPRVKVALQDVTEEKLETAVTAKVKPQPEEQVEVLAAIRKPTEAIPQLEEAPEEVKPEDKPSIIFATEEVVAPTPLAQEYMEIVPEEELETAITKVAPQPEDEADVLATIEKVTPVEATPSEVILDVSEVTPVTIRSLPEKESLVQELLEVESFPEEEVKKEEAVEVVVKEEQKAEEIPIAPVITDKFKSKVI